MGKSIRKRGGTTVDIQKLIDSYATWLKEEITCEKVGEYYEITTPYLDNANDYLQIYVKQEGNDIYFSDDGQIIRGLKMNGFQFTPTRRTHLQRILTQYGIKLDGDELNTKAPIESFAQKKHMLIQAMLRIDDMCSLSKSKVSSIFLDDIQAFFNEKEIYYSENVQFTGHSGYSHCYDFLLQRSRTKPERLCQAVNTPNKSNMGNILFAWNDTKPSRRNDSELIVFLNDQNTIARGIEEAFQNYQVKAIRWSQRMRQENLEILSA